MERQVIFRDGQDVSPTDFTNLQDFAREAVDHLVADAVTTERKFAGFLGAVTGVADVTFQPGRFYSAGQVYALRTAVSRSFLPELPLASKKHALVTVYGQEEDGNAQPREFLLNETTGESQAKVVPLERARVARLGFYFGEESPDPIDPIVDPALLPIARVVLTPTGVTVEMLTANRVDSAASNAGRIAVLEDFRAKTGPQIGAISSDVASLKEGQAGLVNKEVFGRLLARTAAIEEKAGIPSNATDSDCDFFLDLEESDPAFAGYQCLVEEGIRFGAAASATSTLALLNTLDPLARTEGDLLLPAYRSEQRLAVGPRQAEVQVSSYRYQVNEMVQRTMSRTRIRYGDARSVCTNSAWWQSGQYDQAAGIFSKDGETFTVALEAEFGDVPGHNLYRVTRFWHDSYEEPYWAQVTVQHAVPGAQVAETFLNANAMILAEVGLTFTRLAATGSVTLAVCETDRGQPDLSRVIAYREVDRAALQVNAETRIGLPPTFLQGGKRYAIVVTTAADHWLATTQGENFPQGTFFYVLDGAYQQGDGTRDLCFSLYAAKFTQARAVIEMQPLVLDGGITDIDILADCIVPGSTDLTYEVRVGAVWRPLGPATASAIAAGGAQTALLPLRAVYTGTPDVMPMLKLAGSRVVVSRPRTTLTHVSQPRTLPGAGSQQIRVIGRLEYFDPAHHSAVAKLRTGAGFAAAVNASSVVDQIAEDGSVERTWIFNLGAAVTAFRIQFEAATDSAARTFHFGWRKDFAL